MHKTYLTADERSRGNHSSGSRKEQVDVVELHRRRRWWLRRLGLVVVVFRPFAVKNYAREQCVEGRGAGPGGHIIKD